MTTIDDSIYDLNEDIKRYAYREKWIHAEYNKYVIISRDKKKLWIMTDSLADSIYSSVKEYKPTLEDILYSDWVTSDK